MKTIEKIYPSRQAYDITQKTSRLFQNKGEEAVTKHCEKYNFKQRYCDVCQKDMLTIRIPNNCVCVCCNQSVSFDKDEKEITQDLSWQQHHYMTQEMGYDELKIKGYGTIYRAKLPHSIQEGDIFNIYFDESSKEGCIWLGTLEESLTKHLEKQRKGKQKWTGEPSLSERIKSLVLYRDTRNCTLEADKEAYDRTQQQIDELRDNYYE